MKGVSEIISVIMILMIVIALSALAYTWFSGMFSDITKTASASMTSSSKAMATQFKIESVTYSTGNGNVYVNIRNIGTQNFNASRSIFYVKNSPGMYSVINCASCNCNDLAPGCIASYTISGAQFGAISNGDFMRVTIDTGGQGSMEILTIA